MRGAGTVSRYGPRILPGLRQFRGYRRQWLTGDLLAGVTVAAYLVPQVMAYASVAGLPPVTGLWAAVGPLAVYVLFGSSRQLSVGPESTTALMTAVALAPLAAGDPARYATLAAMLAVLVGAVCLLGSLVRLGVLAELLSKPVLVGYLCGIAVVMIASQLGRFTGVPVDGESFVALVRSFAAEAGTVHWPTLALSSAILLALLLADRLVPRLPAPLIAILLATLVVAVFSLQRYGIAVVGDIPSGLPVPGLSSVSSADLLALALPAAGIAIVGFSDNVLTARAFAGRAGHGVEVNQELAALGAINVSSGLLHGFPVSCSGSRTALGDAVGSRTQLYSVTALAAVLVTLLVAGPLLARFPVAALAALVVYAALRLINVREFRRIARFRHSELLLALGTTVGVLALGVLYGVLAAVALSIVDLLRKLARPHDAILGYVAGVPGMHDVDDYPAAQPVPGLVVYRYDAPLCFANAEDFRRRALASLDSPTARPEPVEWFLLNAEANVEIDVTGADAVEQLRAELSHRGITFAIARVKQDLRDKLVAAGLAERIGTEYLFMTLPSAIAAYTRAYAGRHGALPPGMVTPVVPPDPMRPEPDSE
ncbi:SulP family inorganic anion transporter [Prauserella cavernicola]|uniref:Sulfate permease n=1 Tax=Prauserella cavernicola TaxID=2800127 RepID=A0A934QVW7_9PSEU|nr:sulfate permease [Prauserella cavernicola]MBK1787385.1 sulfate permease [Prauserella cavernicola]